jgi:hypothetical protein
MTAQDDDAGRRSARAKIAVTLAKFRLAKERFETVRDTFVDRDEAIAVARADADFVIQGLRAAPATQAAAFANELGIDAGTARAILEQFIALALAEIGDYKRQAERDAERA